MPRFSERGIFQNHVCAKHLFLKKTFVDISICFVNYRNYRKRIFKHQLTMAPSLPVIVKDKINQDFRPWYTSSTRKHFVFASLSHLARERYCAFSYKSITSHSSLINIVKNMAGRSCRLRKRGSWAVQIEITCRHPLFRLVWSRQPRAGKKYNNK